MEKLKQFLRTKRHYNHLKVKMKMAGKFPYDETEKQRMVGENRLIGMINKILYECEQEQVEG